MNHFDLPGAFGQAGPGAEGEIQEILDFLKFGKPTQARYASSIITRSEAQLFGLSIPRFAVRLYLGENCGYINCRRLKVLSENITNHAGEGWGYKDEKLMPGERNDKIVSNLPPYPPLKDVFKNESAIADCFFKVPPSKYPLGEFYISRIKMHSHYGEIICSEEENEAKDNCWGTPYVRCIEFGGGLCAQAVCYIATALLKEHAEKVLGPAEITALAHPDECNELIVSGLQPDNIVHYFSNVGLKTDLQVPCKNLYKSDKSWVQTRWYQELRIGLDAYLSSYMPVIFLTNMQRLIGDFGQKMSKDTVYGFNGFQPDWKQMDPNAKREHSGHAFVLLGCDISERVNDMESLYIFHDPARWPYMKAKLNHLASAGPYWPTDAFGPWLNGLLMPVVPKAVKMSLLWWKVNEGGEWTKGLLGFSDDLHNAVDNELPHVDTTKKPSEFYLARIKDLQHAALSRAVRGVSGDHRMAFAKELKIHVSSLCDHMNWKDTHWLWVESNKESVWLWDAEEQIESIRPRVRFEAGKYLRSILFLTAQKIEQKWVDRPYKKNV